MYTQWKRIGTKEPTTNNKQKFRFGEKWLEHDTNDHWVETDNRPKINSQP